MKRKSPGSRSTPAFKIHLARTTPNYNDHVHPAVFPVILPDARDRRQTGSSEVIGLVAGREIDWQNASISAAPFPNPANDAALAQSSDAVLTLKPVPFFVRRQLASQNLPVPMFLPTFQWGRHPLSANLPLIIGGAFAMISFLMALLQTRKRESFVGRPSDL